jgi:large subunit ribosomal protein L3
MPKEHRPRRGSLAFSPRVRAASPIPHVRSWPNLSTPGLLGIGGYKVGMTHVLMIDDRKTSLTAGQTIAVPVTVVEVPPVFVFGLRMYRRGEKGLEVAGEIWSKTFPKYLDRILKLPKQNDPDKKLEEASKLVEEGKVEEIRVLCCTQPYLIKLKKTPDIFEVPVGGSNLKEKFEVAKKMLGKEMRVSEIFKAGEYIDVIAITKGKGFQGPVKRWGVKILPRKTEGGRRQVGTLGPWHPAKVMWSVPQAGQMGYHQRTEYNKRILKIGEDGGEITVKGGYLRYGPVTSDYLLIAGSIPGPSKRFVLLRKAIRMPAQSPTAPTITYVSLSSKQGK